MLATQIARSTAGFEAVSLPGLFSPDAQVRVNAPLRLWHGARPAVYRVESGWCARTRVFPDGGAQIVDLLMPGDLIGLEWLDGKQPRDLLEALSDTRLSRCDVDDLRSAMARDQSVAGEVVRAMLAKHEEAMSWMAVLGQGDARSRLAFLLLLAARRNPPVGGEVTLPLTQQRLGELLGLTPVHVNRMVRDLRENRLAIVARGRARLLDVPGLAALAGGYRGEAGTSLAA